MFYMSLLGFWLGVIYKGSSFFLYLVFCLIDLISVYDLSLFFTQMLYIHVCGCKMEVVSFSNKYEDSLTFAEILTSMAVSFLHSLHNIRMRIPALSRIAFTKAFSVFKFPLTMYTQFFLFIVPTLFK